MEIGKRYHTETIIELVGMETSVVSTNLLFLEISNIVKSLPGGFYERIK